MMLSVKVSDDDILSPNVNSIDVLQLLLGLFEVFVECMVFTDLVEVLDQGPNIVPRLVRSIYHSFFIRWLLLNHIQRRCIIDITLVGLFLVHLLVHFLVHFLLHLPILILLLIH
jgi:hypothetical protein